MSGYEGDDVVMDIPQNLSNLAQSPASYDKAILERNETRFFATGTTYNNQSKDIQIRMNSAGYCDATTAYLYLDLRCKHSGSQVLDGSGVFGLLGQATLKIGGKIVERVEDVSALAPLLLHSCSEEWLQTEGRAMGMWRYVKSTGMHVNAPNTAQNATTGNMVGGDPYDLSLLRVGGITGVVGIDAGGDIVVPKDAGYTANGIGINTSSDQSAGVTQQQNSYYPWGKNSPSDALWYKLGAGTNQEDGSSRTYAIPLSLIFGFFRAGMNTYLPIRNMPVEMTFQLKEYNTAWIHTPPCVQGNIAGKVLALIQDVATATTDAPATGTKISTIVTDLLDSNFTDYTISNVRVLCDIVSPAPSVIERVDSLAQGSTGIQMVLDSYNVIKEPRSYSTDISLHSTRSYSHLKDIYYYFKPSDLENNLFLPKQDTWYGSLVESVSTTIGSKLLPSSNPQDSPAEMFGCLKKCLNTQNRLGNARGVVNYLSYQGKPDTMLRGTYKHPSQVGRTPSLQLARTTGAVSVPAVREKLAQATQIGSMPHSQFVVGVQCQRVLGSNSLSGLNTLGQGFSINSRFKFKQFIDSSPSTDPKSFANNESMDVAWGNAPMICTQVYHSDILLSVAEGAVQVLE
jgi:hypothetical protein